MALPTIKDLIMYVNKALDSNAWNTNWQKIVNWLTTGTYDIKVKSIEISQDGGITNNGTFSQGGNLDVGGTMNVGGNLNVDGIISGDGSGLTGVISSAQISYTPFCVNSGNVDTNGNGDLFDYSAGVSTSIQFKVGDGTSYKPITFTNAKGKTTTLESINSYDLSQTDNGTYIVYIEENSTAVTLTDNNRTIFRQPYAPTVAQNPQPSDIWLDTSAEGLKSYIRASGTWEESNLTPLGTVTVNNHTIQSAETFVFNQNGYDINGRTKIAVGITNYAMSSLVSGTSGTVYGTYKIPQLVIVGATNTYDDASWSLQVSTDNSTWTTVAFHKITSGSPSNGVLQSVIVDKGLYFKLVTTGSIGYTLKHAPIWENQNN